MTPTYTQRDRRQRSCSTANAVAGLPQNKEDGYRNSGSQAPLSRSKNPPERGCCRIERIQRLTLKADGSGSGDLGRVAVPSRGTRRDAGGACCPPDADQFPTASAHALSDGGHRARRREISVRALRMVPKVGREIVRPRDLFASGPQSRTRTSIDLPRATAKSLHTQSERGGRASHDPSCGLIPPSCCPVRNAQKRQKDTTHHVARGPLRLQGGSRTYPAAILCAAPVAASLAFGSVAKNSRAVASEVSPA